MILPQSHKLYCVSVGRESYEGIANRKYEVLISGKWAQCRYDLDRQIDAILHTRNKQTMGGLIAKVISSRQPLDG